MNKHTQTNSEIEESDNRFLKGMIGYFIFLLPGILLIGVVAFSKMGSINSFLTFLTFLAGIIPMLTGIVVFLVIEEYIKRKLYFLAGGILFYVLLIPMIWLINDLKLQTFLLVNGRELEIVALDILNDKTDLKAANHQLIQHGYYVHIICVPEEKKQVLFLIDGLLDNCYGFSYSLSNAQPSHNCCGRLTSWKKLRKNWYKWTTT